MLIRFIHVLQGRGPGSDLLSHDLQLHLPVFFHYMRSSFFIMDT